MVKINTMYIYDIERTAGEFQPNLAQSILTQLDFVQIKSIFFF